MPEAKRPWYWKGNVQTRIVQHLAKAGYNVVSSADTASRAQGKDIVAVAPDGDDLWVSVKGYPERNSHTQARHWFSHALFDLVMYRDENATAILAIGLPDGYATYRNLYEKVKWLRNTLPFGVFWVSKSGSVVHEH